MRIRDAVLPGVALALTATCSSSPPSAPTNPGPSKVQPTTDLTAVALGVTIDARDDRGAPRLIRAIVPRKALVGMTADEAARDHLAALKPLYLHNQQASTLATKSTQKLRGGSSVVRLRQQVDNIDIHQAELRVMVQQDGSLVAVSGTVRAGGGRTTFRSTPTAALDRALDVIYGKTRARPAITEGAENAGYRDLTVADNPEFRVTAARAKRELMPDGDQLFAIWSVEVFTEKAGFDDNVESKARRLLISDDGRMIRDVNLIASDAFVYRAFAETTGVRVPFDGPLESFAPHPIGEPDGSLPAFGPYNLVVMEAFNGPRDPWLPNNATTTSGNNVDAFADIAPPLGFNAGDIRPEVRAGRTLNYRYDFTLEPLANVNQSKAAAVNLFFVQNWLHDWFYDSGFTEATGNAQVDNFGRGGVGGDPVVAHAQANALGGSRDNANMATPEDGLSPVTNMFLWSGRSDTSLTTPTATPTTVGFVTGPRSFELTGEVALATNTADGTHTACTAVDASVNGKIALFEFNGLCGSVTAVNNVKAAGAIGVIAMIAVPGAPAQSLNGSAAANIPGLVVGFDDGEALKAAIPVTVTLSRTTSLEHDGDFDNAIIAHEWGHYMHFRLASCEATNQCFAMSEGWGDFVALMMMLRDTDNRDGTFGTGLYALTAGGIQQSGFITDPGYFGIRRFPYSINRAKNGLSFRHIGDNAALPDTATQPGPASGPNSEVHNAGEIWATMMWEAYNVLIDEHPHAEAHRRMTDYVVAGLLLTPPEATFTEARDAILAAAGGLDTEDMILMAAAFAGRGAGTCAVSPDRTSVDFTGVVESGTIAAKLETSPITVSDDGVSCDHDGILDPGESGTIHITVANGGVIAAEGVSVTATTTTPGVTLGRRIEVGDVAALSHIDLAIPIRLAANAPVNSTLNLTVTVQGDAGCSTGNLAINLATRIGVDEQANVSASDDLETRIVAWTPTGIFGGDVWSRQNDNGNNVLFGIDAPFTSDTALVSPVLEASATDPLVVNLKHAFSLEAIQVIDIFFDAGVIEVSNDNGATWRDVTEVGIDPGYTGTVSEDFDNPLAGREGFSGNNASFPDFDTLSLNFGTQFAGQSVQLRFRLGTDFCCAAAGWEIDDISVSGITNTPFPGFVPEPTTCTGAVAQSARKTEKTGVVGVRAMPHASLDGVGGVLPNL